MKGQGERQNIPEPGAPEFPSVWPDYPYSQAEEIRASIYGVSPAASGKANSEALAAAIAAAEAAPNSRVVLPAGRVALTEGFLLNLADDESGEFQYIIQGDGRGTVLELDEGLDWLFRVNCSAADEPVHPAGNLIGRLVLRDLLLRGVPGGSTGLARTNQASVHLHNVRGFDLDWGVYQAGGYCDHHIFEKVRWDSEGNENGWLLYMAASNGDNQVFRDCDLEASNAAYLKQANGAEIQDCIGGKFVLEHCTNVRVDAAHCEAFAPTGKERPLPAFKIVDSRVRFGSGFFLTGAAQPAIEIDDAVSSNASQITFAATNFGWPNGLPGAEPPRTAHIHIAALTSKGRIVFEHPRAFCVNHGTNVSDPIGLFVTSDVAAIQEAIDAAPELLNSHSVIQRVGSGWELSPVSRTRTAKRWGEAPSLGDSKGAIGAQLEAGGTIPAGAEYFYRLAVWDGFQWSAASIERSAKATVDDTAFVIAVSALSPLAQIRIWRGPAEGEYDRFITIPVPTSSTRLTDIGDYIAGLAWIAEGVPAIPEVNSQYDLVSHDGRIVVSSEGAPSKGTWARGTRSYNPSPEAGGNAGAICTAAGTPGTWKSFGAISA